VTNLDPGPARVFVELTEALGPHGGLVDAMDILVHACTDHTNADQAAVVIRTGDGTYRAVASTHERTLDVEEAQIGTTGGPCISCITTGEVLEVPDIGAVSERWPAFARTAHATGLGAALAIPVTVDGDTIAGVNVFLAEPGHLSEPDMSLILALTRVAAAGLAHREAAHRGAAIAQQLTEALESRVVIEQAKGFLAYQHGTDVSEAFTRLRRYARNNRLPLRGVASAIVDRTLQL